MEFTGVVVCSVRDILNNFCELKDKHKKGYMCDFYSKELMKRSKYFVGLDINDCIVNFVESVYKHKNPIKNKDEVESGYIFLVTEYFGKEYICLDNDKILKMFEYELENWIISINWIKEFNTKNGILLDIDRYIQKCFKTTNFYGEKFALVSNYREIEDIAM